MIHIVPHDRPFLLGAVLVIIYVVLIIIDGGRRGEHNKGKGLDEGI